MASRATPDDDLPARLHSAVLHLLRRLAREDVKTGVSPPRLSALSVLVFGGPRTIGALAVAERVTPPTMTRLVAAMEADGLVVRSPDPDDRRAVRVAASARGRRLLVQGRDQRIAALSAMLQGASSRELATLADASRIIEERLLDGPPGS